MTNLNLDIQIIVLWKFSFNLNTLVNVKTIIVKFLVITNVNSGVIQRMLNSFFLFLDDRILKNYYKILEKR